LRRATAVSPAARDKLFEKSLTKNFERVLFLKILSKNFVCGAVLNLTSL
jgi:hypothetical protein